MTVPLNNRRSQVEVGGTPHPGNLLVTDTPTTMTKAEERIQEGYKILAEIRSIADHSFSRDNDLSLSSATAEHLNMMNLLPTVVDAQRNLITAQQDRIYELEQLIWLMNSELRQRVIQTFDLG